MMDTGENLELRLKETEQQLFSKKLEIESLLEITKAINNNLEQSALYRIFEFILRAQMGIKKLCLFIKTTNDPEWCIGCCYGVKGLESFNVEESLIKLENITPANKFPDDKIKEFQIIIPVYHNEKQLAYSLVGREKNEKLLNEEETKFIQTITNIVAVAIENKELFKEQLKRERFMRELEVAAQMQAMLVPEVFPDKEFIEMAATYLPQQEVGGDYYDYFEINEDEIAFCIADISGKGIAAAILMSNFQANLRALIRQNLPLKEMIIQLNEIMVKITRGERFVTFFIGIYNKKTRKLRYINAGHNPQFAISEGEAYEMQKGSTIIGMFEELPSIAYDEIELKKGTMIVQYTDGLTDLESESGERFELERLLAFSKENHHLSAEAFKNNLLKSLYNFKRNKPFNDDITMFILKINK